MQTIRTSLVILLPLFLVIIIDTMGSSLVLPVVGPLFLSTGSHSILPVSTSLFWREFLYGITLASFCLVMLVGAPFLGDLSDYFGRKNVLLISLVGTGLAYIVSGYGIAVHSVLLLLLGRCLGGFFAGSQPIAQASIADMSTKETKAKNLGYMVFAASLGFIIGPVIGGYFANPKVLPWFNYATPFYAAGIIALINALLMTVTMKNEKLRHKNQTLNLTRGLLSFVSAFTYKPIRIYTTSLLLTQTGFAIFFAFLPLYIVQKYHYNSAELGHFMAYFGLIWAVTFLALIPLILRFLSLEQSLIVGLAICGLGMLLAIWPNEWITWISIVPIAIFNGLSYTTMMAILSNGTSPEKQGWIMGITTAVIAAAWGIGTLLSGVLGSHITYLPFVVAAILTFLSLGVFMLRRATPI